MSDFTVEPYGLSESEIRLEAVKIASERQLRIRPGSSLKDVFDDARHISRYIETGELPIWAQPRIEPAIPPRAEEQ